MVELCLTLAVKSPAELQKKISGCEGDVSLAEIRLDFLEPFGLPVLPSGSNTRFLATCRPLREGGQFSGPEPVRIKILCEAAEKGFSFIDLESDVVEKPVFPDTVRIVRSRHDFGACPADLSGIYGSLLSGGGDLAKLVVTPQNTSDLIRLLLFMEENLPGSPGIVFGMGQAAQVTRIVGPFLGCAWTYVSESGNSVAPGQFSLGAARNLYRLPARRDVPDIFGVAGSNSRRNVDIVTGFLNLRFQEMGQNAIAVPLPDLDTELFLSYALNSRLPYRGFVDLGTGKAGSVPGCKGDRAGSRPVRLIRLSDGQWNSHPFHFSDPGKASREIAGFWMG